MDIQLLEKTGRILEDGIRSIVDGGSIQSQQVCIIKDALVAMSMIEEYTQGGASSRAYSTGSYDDGGSYRRGRNQNNGQYMSRGYGSHDYERSGHSVKDKMIAKLEEFASEGNEYDRQQAMSLLNKLR